MGDKNTMPNVEGYNADGGSNAEVNTQVNTPEETDNYSSNIELMKAQAFIEKNIQFIEQKTAEVQQENNEILKEEGVLEKIGEKIKGVSKEVTEYFAKNRTNLVRAASVGLLGWMVYCSGCTTDVHASDSTLAAPDKTVAAETFEASKPTPTEIDPAIIAEQKQQEKEAILEEADNSWTYEEMDQILEGYGWTETVEKVINDAIARDAKYNSPFFYYFIGKNGGAAAPYPTPYNYSTGGKTINEYISGFDANIKVVDTIMFSNIVESVYKNYWTEWVENDFHGTWKEGERYPAIFFINEGGDGFYLKDGGFFDVIDGEVTYISLEEAKDYDFSDDVLELIKQGYNTFIHNSDGTVTGVGNFKADFTDKISAE